jgi:hypothetical protein
MLPAITIERFLEALRPTKQAHTDATLAAALGLPPDVVLRAARKLAKKSLVQVDQADEESWRIEVTEDLLQDIVVAALDAHIDVDEDVVEWSSR